MAKNYGRMSNDKLRNIAQKRYYIKRGFFYHLSVYLIISAALVVIYYLTKQGYPWFFWPVGIWGLFIIGHVIGTINSLRRIDGKPDAIDREMERLRKK